VWVERGETQRVENARNPRNRACDVSKSRANALVAQPVLRLQLSRIRAELVVQSDAKNMIGDGVGECFASPDLKTEKASGVGRANAIE